jgi:hypothetical protein
MLFCICEDSMSGIPDVGNLNLRDRYAVLWQAARRLARMLMMAALSGRGQASKIGKQNLAKHERPSVMGAVRRARTAAWMASARVNAESRARANPGRKTVALSPKLRPG